MHRWQTLVPACDSELRRIGGRDAHR